MARASRKKRLPIASHTGRPPVWSPSHDSLDAIAVAADFPISPSMARDIKAAVDAYFSAEPFERSAPFADAAIGALADIERASHEFLAACAIGGMARLLVEATIDERIAPLKARDVLKQIRNLAMAVAEAREELTDPDAPAFREGRAWARMVRDLHSIMTAAGLPGRISKSPGHNQEHSPFVRFFAALQTTFPVGLSRHEHSLDGLAWALNRAVGRLKAAKPES